MTDKIDLFKSDITDGPCCEKCGGQFEWNRYSVDFDSYKCPACCIGGLQPKALNDTPQTRH